MSTARIVWLAVAALALAIGPGCARKQEVSYQKDVSPLLAKHCASCHTPGQAGYVVSGFELKDYQSLMKGTSFGPVVLPGDALTSVLVMLIEGRADPSINMPHGGVNPMTKEEIATIHRWVEQGAKNN
jgi:uncharacterized membrane protein